MYSIIFSDLSLKQLKKLSKELRLRIISTIKRCRIRPYAHVKKIVESPYFRLRVGDYRVIMDICDNKLRIFVIEMGHRKNIYRQ
ncbi:cytotoxic translational repressor of toxin-antitoxin stability system [Candidatus Woesearchaeota archaeon]|nr:cytotoxic translational repressor of toxin-antitoxin stability system [Candidatus Woesearchaeota archaeon]